MKNIKILSELSAIEYLSGKIPPTSVISIRGFGVKKLDWLRITTALCADLQSNLLIALQLGKEANTFIFERRTGVSSPTYAAA